jgi:hypothetical protein
VMNSDGSSGVDVTGRVGATVPSLTGLAWGLLATGFAVSVIAVLLIVLAARRGSRRTGPPAPVTSGPPPGWAPPPPRSPAEGAPTHEPRT